MADHLDDLHRLAPTVDVDQAKVSFRGRRRRSQAVRRGVLAATAVLVLVAGTAVVVASRDDESPVTVGPSASTPTGPVTFELLAMAHATDEMGTLRAATTDDDLADLWPRANAGGDPPGVDFAEQVVVSITIPDDACPPELTGFDRDGDTITPVFVELQGLCEQPLIPKTFVVALDRSSFGASFTLRLPAYEPYFEGERRITVLLEPGEVSHGGFPTVWAQEPTSSEDGMAAEVTGTLRYDSTNDCFLLDQGDLSYPVVWPAGTVGLVAGPGVVLPDGQAASVGDEVYGGGGYLDVADDYDIPDACLPDTREVAVFNPNESVTVNPAAPTDVPEPACGYITAFVNEVPDARPFVDYTASESPEALFASADLVLYGETTGEVELLTDPSGTYLAFGVAAQAVFKDPADVEAQDVVSIDVRAPVALSGVDVARLEAATVPGIPVVVFANAMDVRPGYTATLEGFATACEALPPIGLLGTMPGWADVLTLDDLRERLDAAMTGA